MANNHDLIKDDIVTTAGDKLREAIEREILSSFSRPDYRYDSLNYKIDFSAMDEINKKPFDDNRENAKLKTPEEEWVWVTGYKGTDRDMKCKNDCQFEIGKKFDMPEGEDAVLCDSGFHFCPKLKDVVRLLLYRRWYGRMVTNIHLGPISHIVEFPTSGLPNLLSSRVNCLSMRSWLPPV